MVKKIKSKATVHYDDDEFDPDRDIWNDGYDSEDRVESLEYDVVCEGEDVSENVGEEDNEEDNEEEHEEDGEQDGAGDGEQDGDDLDEDGNGKRDILTSRSILSSKRGMMQNSPPPPSNDVCNILLHTIGSKDTWITCSRCFERWVEHA